MPAGPHLCPSLSSAVIHITLFFSESPHTVPECSQQSPASAFQCRKHPEKQCFFPSNSNQVPTGRPSADDPGGLTPDPVSLARALKRAGHVFLRELGCGLSSF